MRKVFAGLATLLMLAVVAQFFLAASGAFDTAPNDESFQIHRSVGYGIVLLAVVVTIIGALARMPGRLIGLTGLVAGLAVLQPVIKGIASAIGESGGDTTAAGTFVFGLHALNGLAIMGVLGTVVRQARALSGSGAPGSAAGSEVSESSSGTAESTA